LSLICFAATDLFSLGVENIKHIICLHLQFLQKITNITDVKNTKQSEKASKKEAITALFV
jgi:hypothetical protein